MDPGGGVLPTTNRTKMFVPPADTRGCGGSYEEHVEFPLAQGLVEPPVPQSASGRLTRLYDRQLVDMVKVSTVMIDVNPEPVDNFVPASLTRADSSTNNAPSLIRPLVLQNDPSPEGGS